MRRSNVANRFPLLALLVLGCDGPLPSAPSDETDSPEFG
jgi:hypothetical protein